MKAIEKEPQKRFATAREMLQALQDFEANERRKAEQIKPLPKKSAQKKLWLAAAIVALVVLVAIFSGKIFKGDTQDGQSSQATPAIGMGSLVLNVVPFGSMQVDGESRGEKDTEKEIEVSLAAGKHEVRFQHQAYGSWQTTLTVKANEQTRRTCYFENYFNISAVDEAGQPLQADVVVDNSMTYKKTPCKEHPLGPGNYEITVTKPGYEITDEPQAVTVTVQPALEKKISELTFHLRKLQ
jgi:hypothetical protein